MTIATAFAALRKTLIVRQRFTCCQTCGLAEMAELPRRGKEGYVFYHKQDAETLKACGGTYLTFGTFDDEKSSRRQAHRRHIPQARLSGRLERERQHAHSRVAGRERQTQGHRSKTGRPDLTLV